MAFEIVTKTTVVVSCVTNVDFLIKHGDIVVASACKFLIVISASIPFKSYSILRTLCKFNLEIVHIETA